MVLSEAQIDALHEMINIGMGHAAGVLNEMTQAYVQLELPHVNVLAVPDLRARLAQMDHQTLSAIQMGFAAPFSGNAALVFPPESAAKLVMILVGEDPSMPDLDEIRTETLSEVGNIVLNSVMGAIGNELELLIDYSIPTYGETNLAPILLDETKDDSQVVWINARFMVKEHKISGDIVLILQVETMENLLAAIARQLPAVQET